MPALAGGRPSAPKEIRTLADRLREIESYCEENCPDEGLLREMSRLILDLELGPVGIYIDSETPGRMKPSASRPPLPKM